MRNKSRKQQEQGYQVDAEKVLYELYKLEEEDLFYIMYDVTDV